MRKINEILSRNLNKGRRSAPGVKKVSDAEYFKRWRKCYPDTYKDIVESMKEYAAYKNNAPK